MEYPFSLRFCTLNFRKIGIQYSFDFGMYPIWCSLNFRESQYSILKCKNIFFFYLVFLFLLGFRIIWECGWFKIWMLKGKRVIRLIGSNRNRLVCHRSEKTNPCWSIFGGRVSWVKKGLDQGRVSGSVEFLPPLDMIINNGITQWTRIFIQISSWATIKSSVSFHIFFISNIIPSNAFIITWFHVGVIMGSNWKSLCKLCF